MNNDIVRRIEECKEQKKKVVVITSCSAKKKKEDNIPAEDLYQGQLFRLVWRFARLYKFPLVILSAKYGLIPQDWKISYYDQMISQNIGNKQFIKMIEDQIAPLKKEFDMFIIIMGEVYRSFLKAYFDDRFIIIEDHRGIGGYKQKMCGLIQHFEEYQF